jgi:hypothetical protein
LADSLVELAETRAIARALRFGGIGVEYTGAEEVSHVVASESEREQSSVKDAVKVFPGGPAMGNVEANPPNGGLTQSTDDTKRERNQGNGRATQAQCRTLWALTKKARYTEDDIASLLGPLNVSTFQELARESASQLISYLQTEVAA